MPRLSGVPRNNVGSPPENRPPDDINIYLEFRHIGTDSFHIGICIDGVTVSR